MAAGFPFATDIGIRLEDVEEWGLEPEEQLHRNPEATYDNLISNGATDEEAEFVSEGQRVELNMFTSEQLIEFIKQKLDEHGVGKVVPDEETLAAAWRRAHLAIAVNELIKSTYSDGSEVAPRPTRRRVSYKRRLRRCRISPTRSGLRSTTTTRSRGTRRSGRSPRVTREATAATSRQEATMARPLKGQVIERDGKTGHRYALRFRAYGRRHYLTLGVATRAEAEAELQNVLADVRRGIWQPPRPQPVVEARQGELTFHVFSSEWYETKRMEGLEQRTLEYLSWALSGHLLAYFAPLRLDQITAERIDAYRAAKVREREQHLVERPLGNASINRTVQVLAQVLDTAQEYGHITTNPARGRRRRLKVAKPRRTWLELDEVRSLLDAAGDHRPLLATMTLAGLRVSEACQLRWRDATSPAPSSPSRNRRRTPAGAPSTSHRRCWRT
jgi:hypothetical protein